jgi:hypothetical protein
MAERESASWKFTTFLSVDVSISMGLTKMKSRMRYSLIKLIYLFAVVTLGACSKSDKSASSDGTPPASPSSKQPATSAGAKTQPFAGLDSCKLLTKEEIQAVQGEPFVETKASGNSGAGLSISQCYFQLPQAVNSIVLTITKKGAGPDARDPEKNWEQIFHREEKGEERREEREEGEHEPEKVEGIGDEAFWTGTRVGGALYVLKGNAYIRISVGGAGDQADKIRKSKALAQKILGRL